MGNSNNQEINTSREEDRDEIKLTLDLVAAWHEYGINLATRTLYMSAELAGAEGDSGVDTKMAERVVKNLHALEMVSQSPIKIIMNNPGGDIYHGLAICDAIKQSPCDITVIVRGHAMSMGSLILQAADERVMGPCATQMIHYGTMFASTHAKTFQRWAEEAERLNAWAEQLYLARIRQKRPNFTLAQLRRLLDHDTFLNAEDSVNLGLADRIG